MANYCTTTSVCTFYGTDNVNMWADKNRNGNTTSIAAAKAEACTVATAEIDDTLRENTDYKLPLADINGSTPKGIEDIARRWAGVWLYEGNGVTDWNGETGTPRHKLAWNQEWVRTVLQEIVEGKRKLNAVKG